ncbi:MAG: hypothetical protein ACREH6_05050 [Geminicoccaceae bacterium]
MPLGRPESRAIGARPARLAALEGVVIGAGGLERDAGDREAFEPGDQGRTALGVVGEPADPAGRVEMSVERVFGDVHADRLGDDVAHLFRALCLSSGPGRPGIRSGHQEKRAAVAL